MPKQEEIPWNSKQFFLGKIIEHMCTYTSTEYRDNKTSLHKCILKHTLSLNINEKEPLFFNK